MVDQKWVDFPSCWGFNKGGMLPNKAAPSSLEVNKLKLNDHSTTK